MFEDDYKKAFDNISIDNETKERILSNIKDSKKFDEKHTNRALPYRISFAAVAVAAIVLCSVFIPKTSVNIKKAGKNETVNNLTYADIFNTLKEYRTKQKLIEVFDGYMVDEYVTDDNYGSKTSTSPADLESATTAEGYSHTNIQVENVDEADVIKTDGKYIYYLYEDTFYIVSSSGEKSELISKIPLAGSSNEQYREMYLYKNLAVLISSNYDYSYKYSKTETKLSVFDITNPAAPVKKQVIKQSGGYKTSRMADGKLYLITLHDIVLDNIDKEKPETFVPTFNVENRTKCAAPDSIMSYKNICNSSYTVIGGFDVESGTLISNRSLLGGSDIIYCSGKNIIIAGGNDVYNGSFSVFDTALPVQNDTQVYRFEIENGNINYKAKGEVTGVLEDQFAINEHKGNFFFVSTKYGSKTSEQYSLLTVLDKDLKQIGKIDKIAQGERVYSTQYIGDTCFFVTFRQHDPLFSADISDPENPKIIGELKLPGFSEYMYPYGENMLLGLGCDTNVTTTAIENLKLSMFDISDRTNVIEKSKTAILGMESSPALYSHKSVMLDVKKNLIGFAGISYEKRNAYFKVYSFENGEFVNKLDINLLETFNKTNDYYCYFENSRGVYSGDYLYIVNPYGTLVYSLTDYTLKETVTF